MSFVKVARREDLPPGSSKRVEIDGIPVAIFNVDGTLYAIEDTCSHDEASLAEGFLEGEVVECPRHGARFNVRTGRVLALPAVVPVSTFPVKVENDDILVDVD